MRRILTHAWSRRNFSREIFQRVGSWELWNCDWTYVSRNFGSLDLIRRSYNIAPSYYAHPFYNPQSAQRKSLKYKIFLISEPIKTRTRNLSTGENVQKWTRYFLLLFPTRSSDEYDSAPSRKYSRSLLNVFACIGYLVYGVLLLVSKTLCVVYFKSLKSSYHDFAPNSS